jgi:isoleucyl-tRNA synthetase
MRREDFVLDTWHNSGASPFARFTDAEMERYVPTAFLTEGIDQTRGWANSLLLEHVIRTGKAQAPYKAFLFQGLTQDAKGRKMSKSLGNVVETSKLLDTTSADLSRFYMMKKCSPIDFMNFDLQELNRRTYQILSTLYHLSRFFLQNAEFDKFDPQKYTVEWAEENGLLSEPDRWVLSKLQGQIGEYDSRLEACQFNAAVAILEDFVIDTLSRLYVPMIRKELWTDESEKQQRREAIYAVLHQALKTITLLFNPVTPYISEALYQNIYRKLDSTLPESVNLAAWPQADPKLRNAAVEEDFEALFRCVSLVNAARQTGKLKRRWPLRTVVVVAPEKVTRALENVEDLFLEMTNIKNVEYTHDASEHAANAAWVSAVEADVTVFISGQRDDQLMGEGIMRDLSRRVQALRKEMGFMPTDVLESVHIAELDAESMALLKPFLEEMAGLVRTRKVYLHAEKAEVEAEWHESELDGKKIYLLIH